MLLLMKLWELPVSSRAEQGTPFTEILSTALDSPPGQPADRLVVAARVGKSDVELKAAAEVG